MGNDQADCGKTRERALASILSTIQALGVLKIGALIFVLSLGVRLPLAIGGAPDAVSGSESINIVLSLVETGNYAGTYGKGSGPTAHCLPLNPLLQAALLKLTGVGRAGAIAIVIMACTEISLAYALLPLLGRICGLRPETGALAGVLGALLPVNFWAQTSGEFEYSLTALLLVATTCLMAGLWVSGRPVSMGRAAGTGLAMGLGALTSSSVIPVFLLWALFGLWRFKGKLPEYLKGAAVAAAVCVAVLSPWALRNQKTMGTAIWTRSNFGLELQVSNNVNAKAWVEANVPAYKPLHPFHSRIEREKVRKLGEYEYNKGKLKEALDWIATNPGSFLRLTAERVFYLVFIPGYRLFQTVFFAVLTVLGAVGLAGSIRERRPEALLFVGLLAGYPAINSVIQVSARYRFPIEWVFLLLGAQALVKRLPTFGRG